MVKNNYENYGSQLQKYFFNLRLQNNTTQMCLTVIQLLEVCVWDLTFLWKILNVPGGNLL